MAPHRQTKPVQHLQTLNPTPMTSTQSFRTKVLVIAMALAGLTGQAGVFVFSDTPTSLSGSFTLTGSESFSVTPSLFTGLFGTESRLFGQRADFDNTPYLSFTFIGVTEGIGFPNNPGAAAPTTSAASGTYFNGGPSGNIEVNWSFSNLSDTGVLGGTFSGEFSFVAVPEPSDYAAIFGTTLVAFGLWRRNRM
jgi:hypothetical protein